MARQKVEQTGSYLAIDEDGDKHTIYVFTTFIEVTQLSGPANWIPGLKSHKMQNGNHVNVHDDGSLEDVHTGRRMKKI